MDGQRSARNAPFPNRERTPIGLTHSSLRSAVLDAIRRDILSGRFAQGERLPEEELASELEVSRHPVREALHTLAAEGFVELEPRRGARVAVITAKKAEELFEVRQPLEATVARLAARRRTDEQLGALCHLVRTAEAVLETGRVETLPELNEEFHRLLAEAADNNLLSTTLERMSQVIRWVYAARVEDRSAASWSEHRDLVDAIAKHDDEAAAALATAHISAARAAFLGASVAPPLNQEG
jgi:DNA-binding GntR family transcriptional regulator